ncbi:iron uptake transporter deferrochelatase/peroxidase subunit [Planomonospora alba]|uniref:Iron uptake transporter deferrochelatase/peroxidase subunit n=1 Tax=Planomonospora alba TaxID=161354 RepID=A0ABP6NQD9_9ACTN
MTSPSTERRSTAAKGGGGSAVSRRALITSLAVAAGAGAGAVLAFRGDDAPASPAPATSADPPLPEPSHGTYQAGIATPQQRYACFAAFDLDVGAPAGKAPSTAQTAVGFQELMERWSGAAERLMRGRPAGPLPVNRPGAPADSGIADGLQASGLTVTFGLGPELFDRIGRKDLRPRHLRELPAFSTDRLEPAWSGGQLFVQICGDDPQIVSHAFRSLRGRAPGLARLRWSQQGFLGRFGDATPRNLFGHKDGTANPRPGTAAFDDAVRVTAADEPSWFTGGTYLVFRKIRMDLPKWDTSTAQQQDQTIGRRRDTGAPLSGGHEFTPLDLTRTGPDGEPLIPADSHLALVRDIPMLRRSYNYDYAFQAAPSAEHRHDGDDRPGHSHDDPLHDHAGTGHDTYDTGMLFCAYLRDPADFIRAQRKMAAADRLNAFIQHTGSAVFAIPPAAEPGRHLAAALFPAH